MNQPPAVFGLRVNRVHLVGAGGMGMAPLGLYLSQLGFAVSGEDDQWNPAVRELLEQGGVAAVPSGLLPDDAELLVFSSAVGLTHPTRRAATARGLAQARRGEMLAEAVRGKKLVAVVGSHGKTTTTAMLITALERAGLACDWVVGGLFHDNALPPAHVHAASPGHMHPAPPARLSDGEWVVAEVDESDGTIGGFAPEVTLAVNLDWDHPDHYGGLADLEAAFGSLFAATRGAVFVSDVCAITAGVVARGGLQAPVFSFGRTGDFLYSVRGRKEGVQELALSGRFTLREAVVRAQGEFNAANAAAALAVAQFMGAMPGRDALAQFAGVRRRQTLLHSSPAVKIYEDYAHHPTEIRALLTSLRKSGRLVVVFQPHRFTRTAQFTAEFAAALAGAARIFLMDVYGAGEKPVEGGTSADIYAAFKRSGSETPITYLPGGDAAIPGALRTALEPGDVLVFAGAGDIEQTARDFAAAFKAAEAREAAWDGFLAAVRPRLGTETKLLEREMLAPRTTMRVGGPARVYAEPVSEEELRTLLAEARARALPVYLLGRGSNLIVPDEGVDGLVLSLSHENWQKFEPQPDGRIRAGAGLRLKNLCGLATKAGLKGFEFLEGIPGSVGGALRMNAGAMGGWMFDVVDEVRLMTFDGEVRVLKKGEMHVDYRYCGELQSAIALGAVLRPAATAEATDIRRQMDVYQKKRHETQPREPSAGCIFKNPPGGSAGRLINEAGLKGERVGDAEVSTVHANFIVNRGHASGADVLELVRRVRARVKEAKGVDLEPEVLLYGKEWRDVL